MKRHRWLCSGATPQLPLYSPHSRIRSLGDHQTGGGGGHNPICPTWRTNHRGVFDSAALWWERPPAVPPFILQSSLWPELQGCYNCLLCSSVPVASNGGKKSKRSALLISLILACSLLIQASSVPRAPNQLLNDLCRGINCNLLVIHLN